jgi:hypothetical protein
LNPIKFGEGPHQYLAVGNVYLWCRDGSCPVCSAMKLDKIKKAEEAANKEKQSGTKVRS